MERKKQGSATTRLDDDRLDSSRVSELSDAKQTALGAESNFNPESCALHAPRVSDFRGITPDKLTIATRRLAHLRRIRGRSQIPLARSGFRSRSSATPARARREATLAVIITDTVC